MEEAVCQVFIRGDAKAVPTHVFTAGYDELFPDGTAKYSAGGTTGSSYDCGTMTAEWTSFTNFLVLKSPGMEDLSSSTHFQGFKTFQPNGFDLFLDFVAWELIPAKVTTSPCNGPTLCTNICKAVRYLAWILMTLFHSVLSRVKTISNRIPSRLRCIILLN